jgi:hypothetical protein
MHSIPLRNYIFNINKIMCLKNWGIFKEEIKEEKDEKDENQDIKSKFVLQCPLSARNLLLHSRSIINLQEFHVARSGVACLSHTASLGISVKR